MLFASTLQLFGESAKRLLQLHELGEIVVVERVGLAEVAAGVELVVPDLRVGAPFSKNSTTVFTPAPWNVPPGQIEHGVQVAAFQQQLAQAHRGVVGVREEGVLDDHAAAPAGLQDLDEVLEEQERRLARRIGKFCCTSLRSLPPKGGFASTTS